MTDGRTTKMTALNNILENSILAHCYACDKPVNNVGISYDYKNRHFHISCNCHDSSCMVTVPYDVVIESNGNPVRIAAFISSNEGFPAPGAGVQKTTKPPKPTGPRKRTIEI